MVSCTRASSAFATKRATVRLAESSNVIIRERRRTGRAACTAILRLTGITALEQTRYRLLAREWKRIDLQRA